MHSPRTEMARRSIGGARASLAAGPAADTIMHGSPRFTFPTAYGNGPAQQHHPSPPPPQSHPHLHSLSPSAVPSPIASPSHIVMMERMSGGVGAGGGSGGTNGHFFHTPPSRSSASGGGVGAGSLPTPPLARRSSVSPSPPSIGRAKSIAGGGGNSVQQQFQTEAKRIEQSLTAATAAALAAHSHAGAGHGHNRNSSPGTGGMGGASSGSSSHRAPAPVAFSSINVSNLRKSYLSMPAKPIAPPSVSSGNQGRAKRQQHASYNAQQQQQQQHSAYELEQKQQQWLGGANAAAVAAASQQAMMQHLAMMQQQSQMAWAHKLAMQQQQQPFIQLNNQSSPPTTRRLSTLPTPSLDSESPEAEPVYTLRNGSNVAPDSIPTAVGPRTKRELVIRNAAIPPLPAVDHVAAAVAAAAAAPPPVSSRSPPPQRANNAASSAAPPKPAAVAAPAAPAASSSPPPAAASAAPLARLAPKKDAPSFLIARSAVFDAWESFLRKGDGHRLFAASVDTQRMTVDKTQAMELVERVRKQLSSEGSDSEAASAAAAGANVVAAESSFASAAAAAAHASATEAAQKPALDLLQSYSLDLLRTSSSVAAASASKPTADSSTAISPAARGDFASPSELHVSLALKADEATEAARAAWDMLRQTPAVWAALMRPHSPPASSPSGAEPTASSLPLPSLRDCRRIVDLSGCGAATAGHLYRMTTTAPPRVFKTLESLAVGVREESLRMLACQAELHRELASPTLRAVWVTEHVADEAMNGDGTSQLLAAATPPDVPTVLSFLRASLASGVTYSSIAEACDVLKLGMHTHQSAALRLAAVLKASGHNLLTPAADLKVQQEVSTGKWNARRAAAFMEDCGSALSYVHAQAEDTILAVLAILDTLQSRAPHCDSVAALAAAIQAERTARPLTDEDIKRVTDAVQDPDCVLFTPIVAPPTTDPATGKVVTPQRTVRPWDVVRLLRSVNSTEDVLEAIRTLNQKMQADDKAAQQAAAAAAAAQAQSALSPAGPTSSLSSGTKRGSSQKAVRFDDIPAIQPAVVKHVADQEAGARLLQKALAKPEYVPSLLRTPPSETQCRSVLSLTRLKTEVILEQLPALNRVAKQPHPDMASLAAAITRSHEVAEAAKERAIAEAEAIRVAEAKALADKQEAERQQAAKAASDAAAAEKARVDAEAAQALAFLEEQSRIVAAAYAAEEARKAAAAAQQRETAAALEKQRVESEKQQAEQAAAAEKKRVEDAAAAEKKQSEDAAAAEKKRIADQAALDATTRAAAQAARQVALRTAVYDALEPMRAHPCVAALALPNDFVADALLTACAENVQFLESFIRAATDDEASHAHEWTDHVIMCAALHAAHDDWTKARRGLLDAINHPENQLLRRPGAAAPTHPAAIASATLTPTTNTASAVAGTSSLSSSNSVVSSSSSSVASGVAALSSIPDAGAPWLLDSSLDTFLEACGSSMSHLTPKASLEFYQRYSSVLDERGVQLESLAELAAALRREAESLPVSMHEMNRVLELLADDQCHLLQSPGAAPDAPVEVQVEEVVSVIRAAGGVDQALLALRELNERAHAHYPALGACVPDVERLAARASKAAQDLFEFFTSHPEVCLRMLGASTPPSLEECRGVVERAGPESAERIVDLVEHLTKGPRYSSNLDPFCRIDEFDAAIHSQMSLDAAARIQAMRAALRQKRLNKKGQGGATAADDQPISALSALSDLLAEEADRIEDAQTLLATELASESLRTVWRTAAVAQQAQQPESITALLAAAGGDAEKVLASLHRAREAGTTFASVSEACAAMAAQEARSDAAAQLLLDVLCTAAFHPSLLPLAPSLSDCRLLLDATGLSSAETVRELLHKIRTEGQQYTDMPALARRVREMHDAEAQGAAVAKQAAAAADEQLKQQQAAAAAAALAAKQAQKHAAAAAEAAAQQKAAEAAAAAASAAAAAALKSQQDDVRTSVHGALEPLLASEKNRRLAKPDNAAAAALYSAAGKDTVWLASFAREASGPPTKFTSSAVSGPLPRVWEDESELRSDVESTRERWQTARKQLVETLNSNEYTLLPRGVTPESTSSVGSTIFAAAPVAPAHTAPISEATLDPFLKRSGAPVFIFNPYASNDFVLKFSEVLNERDLSFPTADALASAIHTESTSIPVTRADQERVLGFLADSECTLLQPAAAVAGDSPPDHANIDVGVEDVVDVIRASGSVDAAISCLDALNKAGRRFPDLRAVVPAAQEFSATADRQAKAIKDFFDANAEITESLLVDGSELTLADCRHLVDAAGCGDATLPALETLARRPPAARRAFGSLSKLADAISHEAQRVRGLAAEIQAVLAEDRNFTVLLPHLPEAPSMAECARLVDLASATPQTVKSLRRLIKRKGSFFPSLDVLARTLFTLDAAAAADTAPDSGAAASSSDAQPSVALPQQIQSFINDPETHILSADAARATEPEIARLLEECRGGSSLPVGKLLPLLASLSEAGTTFGSMDALHAACHGAVKEPLFLLSDPKRNTQLFENYTPLAQSQVEEWVCQSMAGNKGAEETAADAAATGAAAGGAVGLELGVHLGALLLQAETLGRAFTSTPHALPLAEQVWPHRFATGDVAALGQVLQQSMAAKKALGLWMQDEAASGWVGELLRSAECQEDAELSSTSDVALSALPKNIVGLSAVLVEVYVQSCCVETALETLQIVSRTHNNTDHPRPTTLTGIIAAMRDTFIAAHVKIDAPAPVPLSPTSASAEKAAAAAAASAAAAALLSVKKRDDDAAAARAAAAGGMKLSSSPPLESSLDDSGTDSFRLQPAPQLPQDAVSVAANAESVQKHLDSMVVSSEMSEEEAAEARSQYITLELSCIDLDKSALNVLAWCHPYLAIKRSRSTIFEKVAETNVVKSNSSPVFSPIILNLYRISHNDFEKDIKIQALSWDPDGGPPGVFGELTTNLTQLLSCAQIADTVTTNTAGMRAAAGPGGMPAGVGAAGPMGLRTQAQGALVGGRRPGVLGVDKRLVFRRRDGSKLKDSGFLVVRKSNIWIHTTASVLSSSHAHSRLFPYTTECLTQLVFAGKKLEKQSSIGSGKADPFVMIYGIDKSGKEREKQQQQLLLQDGGASGLASGKANLAMLTSSMKSPTSSSLLASTGAASAAGGVVAATALATLASTSLSSKWSLVYESEVIPHTLNPAFLPALIPVQALCGGDFDRDILVRVLTKRSTRTPTLPDGSAGDPITEGELIGEFETTIKNLLKSCNPSDGRTKGKKMHLINSRKKVADKSYKNSGDLHILEAKVFTLSARSSELEANLLYNVERPDPTSRRSSLLAANGIASLRREKSGRNLFGALGSSAATDHTADLQKSSLMSKVRAVARLAGEQVEEVSQAQMVTELQRQRTGGGLTMGGPLGGESKSRRGSFDRKGSGINMADAASSGGGTLSATDSLIATMMRKSSRHNIVTGQGAGGAGAASGAGGKASTSHSPAESRRATMERQGSGPMIVLSPDRQSAAGGTMTVEAGPPHLSRMGSTDESLATDSMHSGTLSSRRLRRSSMGASMARNNIVVTLIFRAADLRRMDSFLGWADSYLQLLRLKDDVWSELGATSVVSGEKNPKWETLSIKLNKMRMGPGEGPNGETNTNVAAAAASSSAASDPLHLGGGTDYPLVLKVWHWKKRGEAELMGLFETTLGELQTRAQALQDAAPQLAPGAGSDAQPPPTSAFADGGVLSPHAFPLVAPDLTASGSSKRAAALAKHAGLVYCTAAVLSMRDSNKRKSQKSKRKTLGPGDFGEKSIMGSAEPSKSRAQ